MIELGQIHMSSRSTATPYLLRSYWSMAAMPNRSMQLQVLMCIYLGYLGHEKGCIDLQHAVCTNIISYPCVRLKKSFHTVPCSPDSGIFWTKPLYG